MSYVCATRDSKHGGPRDSWAFGKGFRRKTMAFGRLIIKQRRAMM